VKANDSWRNGHLWESAFLSLLLPGIESYLALSHLEEKAMNKLTAIAIFVFVFTASSALAAPIDCLNFAGNYTAINTGNPLIDPSDLQINFSGASSLALDYGHSGENRFRDEVYVADGNQHAGDTLWTGTFYTATCAPGVISILKDFRPSLDEVYTDEYTLVNGVLTERITFADEGGYQQLRGTYQRQ
jgi:hypothetical protein